MRPRFPRNPYDVEKTVEHQEIASVDLGTGGFELQSLSGSLQFLDKVRRAREENAIAVLDESTADCDHTVRLGRAGRPKQK
jgi:hypothetical protein